jgi:hypothetical protein
MKVFVDDVRYPPDDSWNLVRTVTEAIRILDGVVYVDELSLDHDIQCFGPPDLPGSIHTSNETYEPVARYVAAMPVERRPKRVIIHTANPGAATNMMKILEGRVEKLERRMAMI